MVDLSAGMLLIHCRNEACRALAACAPAAEGNCSDVKRCICRCIHACRCTRATRVNQSVHRRRIVGTNRKLRSAKVPAAIDMPRRVTIQTENGLDTRPREFSEINRTIIEFPFAIIATDKQIEEMRQCWITRRFAKSGWIKTGWKFILPINCEFLILEIDFSEWSLSSFYNRKMKWKKFRDL